MNFFSKNKFITWVLVILVIINVSGLITAWILLSKRSAGSDGMAAGRTCSYMCRELNLSAGQSEKVAAILNTYVEVTKPLADSIRKCRVVLLEELAKGQPDQILLNRCADNLSILQRQMQKTSISQYMELKKICTKEQCLKLSDLYYELYGCRGACKEAGEGKGRMHQYRHGMQKGCSDRTAKDSCR
jgi:hypothetical protein